MATYLLTKGSDQVSDVYEGLTAAQYEDQFEKLMKKIDPHGLMPRDLLDKEW